jgi:hypothetical protein
VRGLTNAVVSLSLALLLAGCAASETRSIASPGDIPASKYKKVAVFIENLDESERVGAERMILASLKSAGINALSSGEIFRGREQLDSNAQAATIRKQAFDAVLYVTVLEKGLIEERVNNAYYDGQMIQMSLGFITVGHNVTDFYVVKPDGSVYTPSLILKTKSDLQDTKSAKQVWTAETISSGHPDVTNMTTLFGQTARQIVDKMRADQAI